MSEMADKTYEMLQQVHDRDSFIAFLAQLRDDWTDADEQARTNPPRPYAPVNDWENQNLYFFLEAAHAWTETTARRADEGFPEPVLPQAPSWKRSAIILYMGKTYE